MHLMLEVFAAALAVVPMAALFLAWRRARSARLALALAAFAVLEVRLVAMVLIHTVVWVDHPTEELIGFGGDLAVIAAFAAAFLKEGRLLRERVGARPA